MPNTDIDLSALAEALNDKMDRDMGNHTNTCHYVVETWHSGTEWYRVWSDGFIEQGGYKASGQANSTVTFLKPFSDTNYSPHLTPTQATGNSTGAIGTSAKTTTSCWFAIAAYAMAYFWYACGY